jgi:hypothetical protein
MYQGADSGRPLCQAHVTTASTHHLPACLPAGAGYSVDPARLASEARLEEGLAARVADALRACGGQGVGQVGWGGRPAGLQWGGCAAGNGTICAVHCVLCVRVRARAAFVQSCAVLGCSSWQLTRLARCWLQVKRAVEQAGYSQIKVVAALMARQQLWFGAQHEQQVAAGGSQQQAAGPLQELSNAAGSADTAAAGQQQQGSGGGRRLPGSLAAAGSGGSKRQLPALLRGPAKKPAAGGRMPAPWQPAAGPLTASAAALAGCARHLLCLLLAMPCVVRSCMVTEGGSRLAAGRPPPGACLTWCLPCLVPALPGACLAWCLPCLVPACQARPSYVQATLLRSLPAALPARCCSPCSAPGDSSAGAACLVQALSSEPLLQEEQWRGGQQQGSTAAGADSLQPGQQLQQQAAQGHQMQGVQQQQDHA